MTPACTITSDELLLHADGSITTWQKMIAAQGEAAVGTMIAEGDLVPASVIDPDNERKLEESLTKLSRVKDDASRQIDVMLRSLDETAEKYQWQDFFVPRLSDHEAYEIFTSLTTWMEGTVVSQQAKRAADFLLSGFDNPERRVMLIHGYDVTHFYEDPDSIQGKILGGFTRPKSGDQPPLLYLAVGDDLGIVYDEFLEEAAHAAIADLYQNSKEKPYQNDHDPRRKLLMDALDTDIHAPGKDYENICSQLQLKGYSSEEFHQEIPAKILKMMVQEQWKPALAASYPQLTAFVNDVILSDYEHKQQTGELPVLSYDQKTSRGGADGASANRQH